MGHSLLLSSSHFLSITNYRSYDFGAPTSSSSSSTFLYSFPPNYNHQKMKGVARICCSWLPPQEGHANDNYQGWAIFQEKKSKKGFQLLELLLLKSSTAKASFTAAAALLLIAVLIAYNTKKGFKFQFTDPLQTKLATPATESGINDHSDTTLGMETPGNISHDHVIASGSESEKLEAVIIPIAPDSTQKEAIHKLKKLKIIEDDVKAGELCTRREYARWLVKLNSVLERNPEHRLVPSTLLSGCVAEAFDDINFEDPDFWSIQVLAESGIVASKLSCMNSSFPDHHGLKDKARVKFSPESFISRLDLVNWRTQLEYSFVPLSRLEEKITTMEVGFMDVRTWSLDASSGLFMDILAGDKSILRKVFGNSRRFQPQKPATHAQAAVALTAGRMAETIRTELSRLEIENSARLAEMEEIRSELLCRGDIQRAWEEKLSEVKAYGLVVARHLHTAIHDLDQEKNERNKNLNEKLRENAALDCQKQLLQSLREEINEMTERLSCEKANLIAEQQSSEEMSIDIRAKQEATMEAKSILEAEKEALRILRSWIEDEAKRSQARAQVLEKVGRRWKWSDDA